METSLVDLASDDSESIHSRNAAFDELEAQQKQTGPSDSGRKIERIYYLDWLRVTGIYLVVFYHCNQCLTWINLWPGDTYSHVTAYKAGSLQVGMPLFFHIAGRAQALSKPKGVWSTIRTRFARLMIPFLVACFALLPFWQYVLDRDSTDEAHKGQPQIFIFWLIWFFKPSNYYFNVGWLWFLPALFLCSVFNTPLLLLGERRRVSYAAMAGALWVGVVLFLSHVGIPAWVMIFSVSCPLSLSILVAIVPFPPKSTESNWSATRWLVIQGSTFIHIVCMIGIVCSFSYSELDERVKMVPALLLFFGFFNHGYFVQRWCTDAGVSNDTIDDVRWKRSLKHAAGLWRIFIAGMSILSIAMGAPVGAYEEELFPIYSASFRDSSFFAAASMAFTWSMIGLVVDWFRANANREFHAAFYTHASASVMVVYVFHFVFVAPFVYWVCRDMKLVGGAWMLVDPILTLFVACVGPFGIYAIVVRYPRLGDLFGL